MLWDCTPYYSAKVGVEGCDPEACDNVNCEEVEQKASYCKGVFKVTIVFLSFAGFLYQATDICTHYFSYRTVVYTNTEQDSVIDLPAVTFCLPTYFSKAVLIDLYGVHITQSIEEAKRHLSNDNNDTLMYNMQSIIFDTFQSHAFKDLSVGDIFNKTIKNDNIIECRLYYPPISWLNMTHTKLHEIIQYGIPCEELAEPVESINANGKCFTYFNQMGLNDKRNYNSFKISANRGYRFHSGRIVKLTVHFARDTYAAIPDGQKRECLQVHPPFKIPSEACLHTINPGMSYDFVLTKTKAVLQPPPYQTDCRSYHIGGYTDPKSRSDCIDKCMIQFYEKQCNCLPIHVTIWPNATANLNLSICNYDDFNLIAPCVEQELSNHCYDRCKPDCIDRQYHLQVESRIFPTDAQIKKSLGLERKRLLKMRQSSAVINIWSDYHSDITYVHTPSMSLIQLVCYLGGLAGLWLGVSVMTVSGWLAQIFPFLHRWNRKQRNVIVHCQSQLSTIGNLKLASQISEMYSPQGIVSPSVWCTHDNEELPLFHRPSICSVSQLNAKF